MSAEVEFLDLEDLLELARRLMGDPPPIRDIGLLGSAVARPRTTLFGNDAYPTIWTKATALLDSIVNNHPLIDGNERLGWVATGVFLTINGCNVARLTNEDVYRFTFSVAAGKRSIDDLASELERLASE